MQLSAMHLFKNLRYWFNPRTGRVRWLEAPRANTPHSVLYLFIVSVICSLLMSILVSVRFPIHQTHARTSKSKNCIHFFIMVWCMNWWHFSPQWTNVFDNEAGSLKESGANSMEDSPDSTWFLLIILSTADLIRNHSNVFWSVTYEASTSPLTPWDLQQCIPVFSSTCITLLVQFNEFCTTFVNNIWGEK